MILQLLIHLSKSDKEYIDKLRGFRNNLMAHPPNVSTDKHEFDNTWKEQAPTLILMSYHLDSHDKCQRLSRSFALFDPLDLDSARESLQKLTQSDEFIEQQCGIPNEGIKNLSTKADRNLDAIKSNIDALCPLLRVHDLKKILHVTRRNQSSNLSILCVELRFYLNI